MTNSKWACLTETRRMRSEDGRCLATGSARGSRIQFKLPVRIRLGVAADRLADRLPFLLFFFWAFRISDLIRRRSAVVPLPFPYQSSVKWEFFFRSRSVTGLFMESRLLLLRWLDYQVGNEEPSTADHLFLLNCCDAIFPTFFWIYLSSIDSLGYTLLLDVWSRDDRITRSTATFTATPENRRLAEDCGRTLRRIESAPKDFW